MATFLFGILGMLAEVERVNVLFAFENNQSVGINALNVESTLE